MSLIKFLTGKLFLKNLALAILLSFLLILSTMLWLRIFTHHGKSRPVPDFYGTTVKDANDIATENKLRIFIIDSVYRTETVPGTIVDQNPVAGEKVKKNRRILLTINAVNPEVVVMPDVVGESIRQAKAILENTGLEVGHLSYIPDLAINNVLKQKWNGLVIQEGDTIPKGTIIDLVLGTGLSNRKTIAPNLTGLIFYKARNKILSASLNIGAVLYDESVVTEEDSVRAFIWKQNPVNDEENLIRLGSPMYLWLTVDSTKLPQPDTLGLNINPPVN